MFCGSDPHWACIFAVNLRPRSPAAFVVFTNVVSVSVSSDLATSGPGALRAAEGSDSGIASMSMLPEISSTENNCSGVAGSTPTVVRPALACTDVACHAPISGTTKTSPSAIATTFANVSDVSVIAVSAAPSAVVRKRTDGWNSICTLSAVTLAGGAAPQAKMPVPASPSCVQPCAFITRTTIGSVV